MTSVLEHNVAQPTEYTILFKSLNNSKAESARYIASWRSQSSYQLPPIEILPKSLI